MQPGDKEEDQGLGEGCEEDDTRDRFETWKVERKEAGIDTYSTWPCSTPGEEHDGHSGCDHGGDVE